MRRYLYSADYHEITARIKTMLDWVCICGSCQLPGIRNTGLFQCRKHMQRPGPVSRFQRCVSAGKRYTEMKKNLFTLAACLFLTGCAGNTPKQEEPQNNTVPTAASAAETAAPAEHTDASVVYFTSDISAEGLVKIYETLEWTPTGKTAVKISTGEPPASNYRNGA